VGLIESFLQTRFIALVILNDTLYRKQLNMLLSIHWPAMIVEEATDAATGLGYAAALKPNVVLLELGLPGTSVAELVQDIRAGNPQATFVGLTNEVSPACITTAIKCGVDYCVPLTPMGHTELVAIVKSIRSEPTFH
ncbi:MAG: response regulator, partial [Thiobacillus sp.]|nr:response regulator [Thiobacillus sp.]